MKKTLMPLIMALLSVGIAQAGAIGTLTFVDAGQPQANGSGRGNINTAATFTIGDLTSTIGSGAFSGFGIDFFGSITFSPTVGNSISFGDAKFGSFTSTSITEFDDSNPGSVSFYVSGNYVGGTYAPGSGSASLTIGYVQTPDDGVIADSSTFSIPPAGNPVAPEPRQWF